MNIFKWSGCLFVLIVSHLSIYAQTVQTLVYENSHFRYGLKTPSLTKSITTGNVTSGNAIATDFTSEVTMPAELNISKRKIVSAQFNIKVNLGDDYIYGPVSATSNAPLDFKYRIAFTIKGFNGSTEVANVFDDAAYELIIENSKPEAVFAKDFSLFTDLTTNTVDASDFLFQRFSIENVTITPLITAASASSTQAEMLAKIANKIRFEISYDIAYGLDVTSTSVKPVLTSLKATKQISKQITFSWDNSDYEFPNYEFQLLRLYNNKQATAVSEKDITTDIDWSKALKIETQSSATSLTLTIPEGTGFYVWRVRPIGTFYDGGIANDLNYSDNSWSVNPGNVSGVHIHFSDSEGIVYSGSDGDAYFYYEDSEADKNWIYSRTFTEENKVSENVVFATPLQQVRQTQSYRASKDNTLITQTIPDNTGRPALTTMGVPVAGKLGEYKENVVQKQSDSKVYTADDYDNASNYRNPSKVEQTNSPLSYYSNQNPDLNIPDAEGYPFQRTLFHNDGTTRVLEQSGVGKTHMISDANNGGKTIKTLYGTASEEELIALFGDEAPNAQSVLTTYTIDQNNTASISYMSKEGKVIATGLSFQDDEKNILDPLKNEGTASSKRTVSDVITQNITTQSGFVSSKRIALLQASPLNISYKVKCQDLENNCLDLSLDCKYKVKVIIHNVENPNDTIVLPEQDLGASVACTPDANGVEYKMVSWSQQALSPGTYVIEKILQAGEPTIAIESKTKAEKQIMPLINKITGWLEGVDCEAELQDFYTKLTDIKNDVNNAFAGGSSCDAACVVSKYSLGDFILTPEHKIDIYNNTAGNPMRLEISSPCCGVMSVSVAYVPPFRCPAVVEQVDANHNGVFDVNPDFIDKPGDTEYFPDFEGYAWSLLKECVSSNFNRDIFYQKYMLGWSTPGDFNKMIYHMLTDKYNAQGVEPVEGTQNASGAPPVAGKDDCGNTIVNTGIICEVGSNGKNTNNCTQYTCSQLIDCWTQQIVLLRSSMCGDGTLSGKANVSNSTDDAAGETAGAGKTHDNHFNDNFSDVKLSRRKKRKIKKKIAKAMRDLSASQANVEYTGFLVKDFLDCTGYKFAKILTTEDPEPLPGDVSGNTAYNVPFTGVGTLTPPCPSGGCKKWPYKPALVNGVPSWPEIIVVPAVGSIPAKRMKEYFPHIKDPLYAFKYFEYAEAERIREIEVLTCYSDPNDCYKTDASGAIVRDGNGRPVKIPCCFVKKSDGTYDDSFCETAVSAPSGNGNYSPSGENNYTLKYYTKEFCDLGKVVCPYTASGWSAGQRYTFYNMLNTYRPQDFDGEDGPEITESELDYTSPMTLYNESTNPFGITSDEIRDWNTWTGSTSTEYPSVVKFDMMKMTKSCEGKCDERRSEFRNKLVLSFTQNGYVIGGCKGADTDNIVPEEDIDLLVDEIVAQCKSQCIISTYQLDTRSCRKINTAAITLGPTNTNIEVEYGVGGCAGNCPGNVAGCQDTSCDPSSGECPATSTLLSRCEQKKWKQVMTWDFEIDMPSKLDADGNATPDGSRKFNCIANPNMADYTELPNSINTGVPDINNFKTAKTVSPAVEINLSLPAKN